PVAFRRHLAMGLLTTNRLATVASLHPRSAATRAASFGISSSPASSSASRSAVADAEPHIRPSVTSRPNSCSSRTWAISCATVARLRRGSWTWFSTIALVLPTATSAPEKESAAGPVKCRTAARGIAGSERSWTGIPYSSASAYGSSGSRAARWSSPRTWRASRPAWALNPRRRVIASAPAVRCRGAVPPDAPHGGADDLEQVLLVRLGEVVAGAQQHRQLGFERRFRHTARRAARVGAAGFVRLDRELLGRRAEPLHERDEPVEIRSLPVAHPAQQRWAHPRLLGQLAPRQVARSALGVERAVQPRQIDATGHVGSFG